MAGAVACLSGCGGFLQAVTLFFKDFSYFNPYNRPEMTSLSLKWNQD